MFFDNLLAIAKLLKLLLDVVVIEQITHLYYSNIKDQTPPL